MTKTAETYEHEDLREFFNRRHFLRGDVITHDEWKKLYDREPFKLSDATRLIWLQGFVAGWSQANR